jgi:uncharacterized protein
MKKRLLISLLTIISFSLSAQKPNSDYDSTLAKKLHGNENGMKKYVMAILKTGSNATTDKGHLDTLFMGHMNNIKRLANLGSLSVAGPLGENPKSYRGIFILNVETFEEAEKLLATDPTIKEKIFETELYSLWCTAALQEVFGIHNKIQKIK